MHNGNMIEDITFSDIHIESQYTEVESRRTGVDITADMGMFKLKLPVFSANMPQITEWKMAKEMAKWGGMGIIHRFNRFKSVEASVKEFEKSCGEIAISTGISSPELEYKVGVSIGVKESDKERFQELYDVGARIFCIDIAHGHSKMMKDMIKWLKSNSDDICIIAGNVANAEGALDLADWGAAIIKTGIGPGSVCRTRSNTGVGKPQFSAIKEVSEALDANNFDEVKIIADGGISTTGDIAKALIYADAVMVGAVLAGTSETPGKVFPVAGTNLTNRQWYKVYGGSASAENKVTNSNNDENPTFVEGEMKTVPFKGKAKYLLQEIDHGIKSAFSYTGASNMTEYKAKVKWRIQSSGGKTESKM